MQSEIQNPKSKIVIVGAGPAGASLAIRLARRGFRVTLVEREKFPRHKLCGEFISPECLGHFRELGVLDEMLAAGGDRIADTIFYSENGKSVTVPSKWFNENPHGALGLSRAEMDFRLMEKAREAGAEVIEECPVVGVLFDGEKVCGINVRDTEGAIREISSDLIIDATGRAKVLAKLTEKEISRQDAGTQTGTHRTVQSPKSKIQNRLVGFKAHLKNVRLARGRCEIYFFRGGYGGLSYVEEGVANHCFLIKAEVVREFKGDVGAILENVIFKNKRARETLGEAENIFDWLAVAVDGFGTKDLSPAGNLITVGDAAAFIDPFTGSGMLMALESAEILAGTIGAPADSFAELLGEYERRHTAKFKKRLRVCAVMRRLAFAPSFARLAIAALNLSKKSRELLARSTRTTRPKKV